MSTLPHPRALLTDLLTSIPPPNSPATTSNPLKDTHPATKHILQTLHVLYPNEFLPALDLLGRQLLTRLTVQSAPPTSKDSIADTRASPPTIYYVRSAQQSRHHFSTSASNTNTNTAPRPYDPLIPSYEVRPLAWNCSCPAFAFAAFPPRLDDDSNNDGLEQHTSSTERAQNVNWQFGGLSGGSNVPVCKHLLACVLVERCEIFKDCVEEREVSIEEIAGWAAGWGG